MVRKPPSVTVLTHSASPYQVELFDRLEASRELDVRVIYRFPGDPDRHWARPDLHHRHAHFGGGPTEEAETAAWIANSDLAVFNWYADRSSRTLIRKRAATGMPWCLWGERPGAGGWGVVGTWLRRVALAPLRRVHAPIWGIGEWAVDGWRGEFGGARPYFNVPYFSDLTRFESSIPKRRTRGSRRVLFSGSLIRRKGVDLLAEAFTRVVQEFPRMQLSWLGRGDMEGELRSRLTSLGDNVRFLGFSSWTDLPSVYKESDLLCAPSRYDGWGLIVPEGLAAGMPVISTDRTGAARELIQPSENGWRIPADDVDALELALHEAAGMADEAFDRMSCAAVQSIQGHTLEKGAARFISAVHETLDWFGSGAGAMSARAPIARAG